jgi:hypothetical protein
MISLAEIFADDHCADLRTDPQVREIEAEIISSSPADLP